MRITGRQLRHLISEAMLSRAAVVHDARKFRWRDNEATGEAGELGQRLMGKLWDDAADVGFIVQSPTGRKVAFVLDHEDRDREGEITSWVFTSHDHGLQRDMTITVFNE